MSQFNIWQIEKTYLLCIRECNGQKTEEYYDVVNLSLEVYTTFHWQRHHWSAV